VVVDVSHTVGLKDLVVLSTQKTSIANLNRIPKVRWELTEEPIEL
jgi:hypothetical protein